MSQSQRQTCMDAYVAAGILRFAASDASFEATKREKIVKLLAESEKALKELAIGAQRAPAAEQELGRQAGQVFDELDRKVLAIVGEPGINELIDRCTAIFFQTAVQSPAIFMLETAPALGINLTADQKTKIEQFSRDAMSRPSDARRANPPDLTKDLVAEMMSPVTQLRAVLTPQQWATYDKAMMEEVTRFKQASRRPPATRPAGR